MTNDIIRAAIENFNTELETLTASTLADSLGGEEAFESISRFELEILCSKVIAEHVQS